MGKRNRTPGSYRLFGKDLLVEVNRGRLTSLGPAVHLKVKDSQNTYELLPQGRIFICFSANTAEVVHRIQNELLLENISPNQAVEWIPMVWEVLTPIHECGTIYNAQDTINSYIDKADHIVFVVKDFVADGLKIEWDKFARKPSEKTIHLCIYANENEMKVHETLDPLKQNIHFPYTDHKDILLYLKSKIHPKAELTGKERKLHFVKTKEQLDELQTSLRMQTTIFKRENVNPQIIHGMEKLIESIDKKGPEILMKNANLPITQPVIIKLNSVAVTKTELMNGIAIPRTKKVKNKKIGRMPIIKKQKK